MPFTTALVVFPPCTAIGNVSPTFRSFCSANFLSTTAPFAPSWPSVASEPVFQSK